MEKKTILLVEDNADDEELTARALARCSVASDLVVVRDGAEALDYLSFIKQCAEKDLSRLPALILLDLKLPRIDGLEVLKRIRGEERIRHIPVVILTSSKEVSDIHNSYRLGANSYICKPVSFEHFMETIGQVGVYWLQLNERLP